MGFNAVFFINFPMFIFNGDFSIEQSFYSPYCKVNEQVPTWRIQVFELQLQYIVCFGSSLLSLFFNKLITKKYLLGVVDFILDNV